MSVNSFKNALRASAPAPADETEEYRRFNDRFSVITLFFMIACAYLASLLSFVGVSASKVLIYFPALNDRATFLWNHDVPSYLTFAATVGGIIVTAPLTIAVFIRGYWITVVAPRKCRRVSQATFLSVACISSVSSAFVWIAFIHVPANYDPRWPGFASILFWPSFPVIGAVVAWMSSMVLFSVFVGIGKAATQLGGNEA
ncbi:MAG: hypothetical protein R3D65_14915 [Zhengella sp.]|uniref:hypothetical protein n=1 Tax=Zhengella sp. TaxID=2282762 RepID=UPI003527A35E|nr:hypothetical protein [Brucellaceae bacterium]